MSEAESLIASIVRTAPGEWSSSAVELAREAIVDTLALAVPGSMSRSAMVAGETVLPVTASDVSSGPKTAPLLTDPRNFGVGDAAFVLATAIHSMDWDDYMHPMHGHCSVVILGALLPVAEALDVNGERLLDAFLIGYQVDWLTSLALSHAHYRKGWHATSTIGVLGAAAAVARLLDLEEGATEDALGIAASMASGIRANFGTTTKALHAGFAARSGVHAVQLAQAGAGSSPDWLVAPAGMIATFGGEHAPSVAGREIRAGASKRNGEYAFHGIETEWGRVQKPYSCCGSIHGAVDALLEVLSGANSTGEEIDSIVAHVDPIVLDIMRYVTPHSPAQAKYSPTWVLAAAAVDHGAGPRQFDAAALARLEIHDLRERVEVLGDWVTDDDHRFGGRVEVRWRGGRVATREVGEAKGHPRRPMTRTERSAKVVSALAATLPGEAAVSLGPVVESAGSAPVRQTMEALRGAVLGNLSSVDSLQYAGGSRSIKRTTSVDVQEEEVGTP